RISALDSVKTFRSGSNSSLAAEPRGVSTTTWTSPCLLRGGSLTRSGIALAGGFAVYTPAQGHCRELLVRRLLFIEVSVEQTDDVVMAEALGPSDQGAVPRDLVMFDRLRCPDDGGIEHILVRHLARDLIRLADEAVDRRTLNPCGFLTEFFEDLVQQAHLVLGLFQMVLEALAQIPVGCLLDQFRQRLDDLIFGVIMSLHPMKDQVTLCLYILGKHSHGGYPLLLNSSELERRGGRTGPKTGGPTAPDRSFVPCRTRPYRIGAARCSGTGMSIP